MKRDEGERDAALEEEGGGGGGVEQEAVSRGDKSRTTWEKGETSWMSETGQTAAHWGGLSSSGFISTVWVRTRGTRGGVGLPQQQ